MKRNKIRYGIWSILIILTITSMASAGGVDSLYVGGTTQGENGQDVDVFINATNVSNVGSLQLDLLFNKGVMIANSVTAGNLTTGGLFTSNIDNNTGKVTIGLINTAGITGTGPITKITFHVVGSEGVSPLNLSVTSLTDPDNHPITPGNVINSTFTVIPSINVIPAFNVSGYKINDTNGNGIWNIGETGIPNWNITISNDTMQETVETNANGFYEFKNLTNGSYNVTEDMRPGWINVSSALKTISIAGQDINNLNFMNRLVDTIPPVINGVILDTYAPNVGNNIQVTVNATDNVGVINVNANDIGLIQDTDDVNIWIGTIVAQEGNQSVNVSARDASGNVTWDNSTTYTGIVNVSDIIPPTINSVELNTSTPFAGDNILVTVNATDNIGVTNVSANNVELTNQDGDIWLGTIVAQEGNQSVNVSARDASGNVTWDNSTTYTGIVNVSDIIPPTINSVELNTSTPFAGDNILVTVNATDNIGVTNVSANDIGLIQDTDDVNIWIGTIVAQEGNQSVNVSARDAAGNVTWDNSTTYTGMNRTIIFGFVADHSTLSVNQSEDAIYILTVSNTGLLTDTYDLTIDNPNNANVSISQENISLDPGNDSAINLTVNSSIPGTYIVNVTATSGTNPLLSRMISTKTIVISPSYIREFSAGNGTRAGSIAANATITNLDNISHWFVVVIGGVNPITGYPLVGTGTVHLDANQTIRVPVLITVPAGANIGEYQLFAGIYPFDEEILDPDALIGTIQGPVISTVS